MTKSERIPVIDVLRGLSCLGILLYHIRVDLWVGWKQIQNHPEEYTALTKSLAWLSIPTPFLGYAILLFFLISGFCIHFPNSIENKKIDWKRYFYRRFWRIYPTYIAALIFTAGISYFCKITWGYYSWDPERIIRVALLSQNYPPANGPFWINPSLWTIPLEIEFYILYPIIFSFIIGFRAKVLGVFVLGLCCLSIFLSNQGILWTSYTFLFFWPVWLSGAWIAEGYRKFRIQNFPNTFLVIGLILALSLAILSHIQNWVSWMQYFVWTIFYILLFVFSLNNQELINFRGIKKIMSVLGWLGKISFSLYLIHFPLFKLFGLIHISYFQEKPASFLISLAYLLPVFVLAWFFYCLIELPIHKWSKKHTK